jgi:hypothetical protein
MNRLHGLIILLLLFCMFSIGCEGEKSQKLYDPNSVYNPDPVITAIEPPDSALAGIVTIKLTGQNFSPVLENNFVHFGKTKATVLEASETQLVVQSPNTVVAATMVKASVLGAISFSNLMPYKLIRGVGEYGGFGDFDDPYILECDRNENLYVALGGKKVVKILPDETRADFGTTTFSLFSSMKFGPDGYLYIGRVIKALYRIPPGGGAAVKWISTPGQVYDFDFVANGMMYTGGKGDSLYLIKPDGSALGVADYPNTYVKAVRVYDGYVYVGGKDNTANQQYIWRNQILTENRVAAKELYFDWGANIDLNSEILSMTFSQNGDLYVGTDSLAAAAMYVVHPDQTFEPLYPTVLTSTSSSFYSLSWGNGSFLYAVRRSGRMKQTRVIKINMLKEGAPYYGRP